jgi:cellulose 1,4-beta-cellobiosidase
MALFMNLTVQTATVTISGKYDIVWISPTTRTYCVQNDVWNAYTPQTLEVNDQTGAFTVTVADHNLPTNGPPASYPSIFKGNHWGTITSNSGMPKQVSDISQVFTSWSFSTVTSGIWNCVYDIWFHQSGNYVTGTPDGAELMIWPDKQGSIQPAGSKMATVSLAGATWDVWYTTMGWKYIAYVRTSTTKSVSFDLNTFIKDSVSRSYISNSWWLISVEAGFELWQNGTGLKSESFAVTVV